MAARWAAGLAGKVTPMAIVTVHAKLQVIERLIRDYLWARNDPYLPEHHIYEALKAIAADLRARQDTEPAVAEFELQRRLRAFLRTKELGPTKMLANELANRWPVVQQALERFGAMAEEER